MRTWSILILLQIIVIVLCRKTPTPIVKKKQAAKIENPNAINDRKKRVLYEPAYPPSWGMEKQKPFSINWMDYCDPYHCGDYHKPACGLNRRRMKFQWFQSGCHIVLNNACATYRGFLKFDQVDTKYCRMYVMFSLRNGCPQTCPKTGKPVCAVNVVTNTAVVFKNLCHFYKRNCLGLMQGYIGVSMNVCLNDIALISHAMEEMSSDESSDTSSNLSTDTSADLSMYKSADVPTLLIDDSISTQESGNEEPSGK